MKCPKCGFNSFDYLESCKKCGNDLKEFKGRFNLRSLLFPYREKSVAVASAAAAMSAPKPQDADFDYGFMEEDQPEAVPATLPSAAKTASAADDAFDIDWNQEEPAADLNAESAGGPGSTTAVVGEFDFSTDSELDGLLQDEVPESGMDATVNELAEPAGEPSQEKPLDVADWSDDSLNELSLDEDLSALEVDAADLPALDEAASDEEDLAFPAFDELDFEDLGDVAEPPAAPDEEAEKIAWGDIDFGEDQAEKPRKGKAGKTGEDVADPFEPPEPAAAGQAPETPKATAVEDLRSAPSEQEQEPQPERLDLQMASAPTAPLRPPMAARFGAFWLDLFLVVGAFLLFLISATRLLAPPGAAALLPSLHELASLSLPYYLLFFLVCFSYFTAFHFFMGQTPGKMLFGLRLEGGEGDGLLLSEAFLHSVGGLVSLLALGLGFFLALGDPHGRGWNDRIAGTRLVAVPLED